MAMNRIQWQAWYEKTRKAVVDSYVWKSIFRHGYKDIPRNRVLMTASNVFLHLHPSKVRRHSIMFYYRPVGEYAYVDMKYLQFDVPFGMVMRNMHRWSAHIMVMLVMLHMFRV